MQTVTLLSRAELEELQAMPERIKYVTTNERRVSEQSARRSESPEASTPMAVHIWVETGGKVRDNCSTAKICNPELS